MDLPFSHKTHSPRDVFLYLLAVAMLYMSTWRLVDLLFQYIDAVLPDKLQGYYPTYSYDEIRFSISTLIIVFPVYLATTWYLKKDMIKNPEKHELRIRKWLLNFTLFVAAITIVVDLVTLINTFLNGELTLRFFLKVLVVLIVVGAILAYYAWDLRRELKSDSKPSKVLAIAVSLVIIGSIVGGFFIVGTPATQRKKRFDEQRVQNLEFLQSQIISFWQVNGRLPDGDINELIKTFGRGISGMETNDPETNIPYEYHRTSGKNSFELCATFNFPSENQQNGMVSYYPTGDSDMAMHNWEHGDGKKCFARTINEKIYQLMPAPPIKQVY